MRFYWQTLFIIVTLTITGCASAPVSQSGHTDNQQQSIAPPQWNIDEGQLSDEGREWLKKLKQYDLADTQTVKMPFVRLVEKLNNWSTEDYCSDQHRNTWQQALAFNPTSLLAYSTMHHCAAQKNDEQGKEKALQAIQNLSQIFFLSGDGSVLSEPIMVRYPHEGTLLFQLAGFHVFDIEVQRFKDKMLYKLHSFDMETRLYSAFYVQNTQFMLYSAYTSFPSDTSPAAQVSLLFKNMQAQSNSVLNIWHLKQALLAEDNLAVINQLKDKQELSPVETVLISQAALNVGDMALLDRYLDDIITYSEQHFVDASAVLAQYLLAANEQQETLDAANLFEINQTHHGDYYATQSYLWSFLTHTAPSKMFIPLIERLDEAALMAWYRQIMHFSVYFPTAPVSVNAKLFTMLADLARVGQEDAQIDYVYAVLEGRFGQPLNIEKGLAYLRALAQQGLPHAQLELGVIISKGLFGVQSDRSQALDWYQKAYAGGSQRAAYNLGLAYRYGTGIERNVEFAERYFKASYDGGFPLAGCRLADIYSEVDDFIDFQKAADLYQQIAENQSHSAQTRAICAFELAQLAYYEFQQPEKAIFWWQQAGQWGNGDAFFELGMHFTAPDATPEKQQQGRQYYEKAIALGNYRAAANLGYLYETGNGVAADEAKALAYYRLSASGNSAQGINNYATFLRYGKGTSRNPSRAVELYQQAFQLGNDYAANNLADMYYYGEIGEPDYNLACDYYQQAVDRQFVKALYDLGYCFFYGQGRDQDIQQGMALLEKSAQAGNKNALNELGEIFLYGRSVEHQYSKAHSYFQQAYQKQSQQAAYQLGLMFENALGVNKDAVLALLYYEQSAKWGNVEGMLATAKAYLYGFGTRKNKKIARNWLLKAINIGSADAQSLLNTLGSAGR